MRRRLRGWCVAIGWIVAVFSVDAVLAIPRWFTAALVYTVGVLACAFIGLLFVLGRLVVSDHRPAVMSSVIVISLAVSVGGFGVLYWAAAPGHPHGSHALRAMTDCWYVSLSMLATVGPGTFSLTGRQEIVQFCQMAYDLAFVVFVLNQLRLGRSTT